MQRDISRYKKSLQQAERDLEDYQQQLIEMRDKARRRQTDEEVQREMDLMREEIESRDNELRELREEVRLAKDSQSQEIEKLRDEIEDLEASVREKERAIDERDERTAEKMTRERNFNSNLTERKSRFKTCKIASDRLKRRFKKQMLPQSRPQTRNNALKTTFGSCRMRWQISPLPQGASVGSLRREPISLRRKWKNYGKRTTASGQNSKAKRRP
jgi:chromosome segregation ATPase